MTRQEFIDNCNDWLELIAFCRDYDIYACEGVYADVDLDEYIDEWLAEHHYEYYWRDIRDRLYDIPTGYDFYYVNSDYGISEINGLDNYDFADYKDDVIREMDDRELWDEDEDEEEPLVDTSPTDTTPVADEPISMDELLSASQSQILVISDKPQTQPVEVEIEAFIGVKATIKGGN